MENDIDPIDYLYNSPFIIFPIKMIPNLKIEDFVEYYRAYPKLNWSKYPKLLNLIKINLNKNERRNLNQFLKYHKEEATNSLINIPYLKYFLIFKIILLILYKYFKN